MHIVTAYRFGYAHAKPKKERINVYNSVRVQLEDIHQRTPSTSSHNIYTEEQELGWLVKLYVLMGMGAECDVPYGIRRNRIYPP